MSRHPETTTLQKKPRTIPDGNRVSFTLPIIFINGKVYKPEPVELAPPVYVTKDSEDWTGETDTIPLLVARPADTTHLVTIPNCSNTSVMIQAEREFKGIHVQEGKTQVSKAKADIAKQKVPLSPAVPSVPRIVSSVNVENTVFIFDSKEKVPQE